MKQEFFTVDAGNLRCYAEGNDLKLGKLRNNATSGNISAFIYAIGSEILADSEDSDEICYEIAHRQNNAN